MRDSFVSVWSPNWHMTSTIPVSMDVLSALAKPSPSNVQILTLSPAPSAFPESVSGLTQVVAYLGSQKLAGVVRFGGGNGDSGVLLVENGGKLVGLLCVRVGLSAFGVTF